MGQTRPWRHVRVESVLPQFRTLVGAAGTAAQCHIRTIPSSTILTRSAITPNEIPPQSINSSARSRNDSGIVRPSAFEVLRLMINSNLVGSSMGKSPGLAPLNILSM